MNELTNHDLKNIISIHAAREGGDFDQAALMTGIDDFNPRRP